eukprot:TRINITY_DN34959_c0_g1_i1.p1 TRINITY_DN34959_c0_g1~~TRINITY_DN34959_c0_g1_i1.p1  ORF type:complete len:331 (-),score=55.58 TRINITY_DN34959_c0_g1_i1:44-1036(-)
MVPVHQKHMPDRLASYTVVVISVMLTQIIDHTLQHQDDDILLVCLLCAVLIPFCLMTLYTNVCGVPVGIEEFTSSGWKRFLTYCHFYLHIPFTGCIIYATKGLQSISCGGPGDLTVTHSLIGISLTLILLGCHHFFVQGNTYDRTLTRIVVGLLLLPLIAITGDIADEWFVGIICVSLVIQVLLEYIFFREEDLRGSRSTCSSMGSPMSDGTAFSCSRGNSIDSRGSNVDPAPLLPETRRGSKPEAQNLPQALERIRELENVLQELQAKHLSVLDAQSSRVEELEEQLDFFESEHAKAGDSPQLAPISGQNDLNVGANQEDEDLEEEVHI